MYKEELRGWWGRVEGVNMEHFTIQRENISKRLEVGVF